MNRQSNYTSYSALPTFQTQSNTVSQVQQDSSVIQIVSTQQRNELLKDPVKFLTVIDNYTTWCGPCKAIEPRYEQLAKTYEKLINFCKEDAEKPIPGGQPVSGVPCFHFYFRGKYVPEATVHGADINKLYENIMKFMEPPNKQEIPKKEVKTDDSQPFQHFIPAPTWIGDRPLYEYREGVEGVGYYPLPFIEGSFDGKKDGYEYREGIKGVGYYLKPESEIKPKEEVKPREEVKPKEETKAKSASFIESDSFVGEKTGYVFKKGDKGLGYYKEKKPKKVMLTTPAENKLKT